MIRSAILLIATFLAGCGVGQFRSAQPTGDIEFRLEADEGERAQEFVDGDGTPRSLTERVWITTRQVREVRMEDTPGERRHIALVLNEAGRQRLAELTRENVGTRLAILVDGQIVSAPIIRTEIEGGEAHISADEETLDAIFDALTN